MSAGRRRAGRVRCDGCGRRALSAHDVVDRLPPGWLRVAGADYCARCGRVATAALVAAAVNLRPPGRML